MPKPKIEHPEAQIIVIEEFISTDLADDLINFYDSQNMHLSPNRDNQLSFSASTDPRIREIISSISRHILKLMEQRYHLTAGMYHIDRKISRQCDVGKGPPWSRKRDWWSGVFDDFQILEFVDGTDRATVTFPAGLKQGGKDVSFIEKSRFMKIEGRWLYEGGEIS